MSDIRNLFDQLKSSDIDVREALSCNAAGVGVQQMLNARQMIGESVGQIGRFELHELVGRGGCGSVFRAFDPQLDRWVALKVPLAHLFDDESFQRRFLHEAKDMARISHPNVVPVYEAGETTDSVPTCYIASEYCPGPSLADFLASSESAIEPRVAATIVATLADALQHVHDANIVHRDIKPSNVLLFPIETSGDSPFPFHVKLTDFGLAKDLSNSDRNSTSNGMVGTTKYMAPEQVLGQRDHVGPATDIHGIGLLLYEMLAGRVPFESDNTFEVCSKIVQEPPPPLPPDTPVGLVSICRLCLQKLPTARYASARDLHTDLDHYLSGRPLQFAKFASKAKFSKRIVIAVNAAIATAILAAAGFMMTGGRDNSVGSQKDQSATAVPIADRTVPENHSSANDLFSKKLDEFLRVGDEASLAKLESASKVYPVEWWTNPETGLIHGYQLVPYSYRLGWHEAVDLAAQMTASGQKGHLATITSESEHNHIVGLWPEMQGEGRQFNIWIGLSRPSDDAPWQWVTGERFEYSAWHGNVNIVPTSGCGVYELRQGASGTLDWRWGTRAMDDGTVRYLLVEYQSG